MTRMKPPIVPERPVPIVPEDGLRRLLAVCAGRGFEARRDTAIMLLLDTGARRAELAGLQLAYVDLDLDVLLALGKGRRERALPFGHKAGEALERYLTALHTGVWSAQRLNPLWVRCPACRQVADATTRNTCERGHSPPEPPNTGNCRLGRPGSLPRA